MAAELSHPNLQDFEIAVLIPCYNEQASIAKVIGDFRKALPAAGIYVYDNNSTDRTMELARDAGAIVRRESLQGKGHVVRRMFADIDADIYILVDGDDTYDAGSAPGLVETLMEMQLDMVSAARESRDSRSYRRGHRFGNAVLSGMVAKLFGSRFSDILSGYKVLSRRFVKSFPVMSTGFEIETELTIHALELRMPLMEVRTPYKRRADGSASKLRTFKDGFRIFRTILILVKEERPLLFFTTIAVFLAFLSIALAIPIFATYMKTGLVPRFPTAILSTGIMILAFISLACGIVLDTVTRGRKEMKRLNYLANQVLHGRRDRNPSQMAD